jgi:hypothetical protein
MKGTLHKTNNGWVVNNGNDESIIVDPYHEKYYFLDEDDEGSEVEYYVEPFWETGMEQVVSVAVLKKPVPELKRKDGKPIRSYHSPKIQELLDEINLEEISKEQLEKERNPAYQYFDIDKINDKRKKMRLIEFLKVSKYRLIEFINYTVCGIEFYRNYDRFYWKNKLNK